MRTPTTAAPTAECGKGSAKENPTLWALQDSSSFDSDCNTTHDSQSCWFSIEKKEKITTLLAISLWWSAPYTSQVDGIALSGTFLLDGNGQFACSEKENLALATD